MATPVEIINAYEAEIQGSIDNQNAQIAIAQKAIADAQSAIQIFSAQIGALEEAKRRIVNG